MHHFRIFPLLLALLFVSPVIRSQTNDFGIWTSLGLEKKLGKWDLGSELELRTMDNSSKINRVSMEFEASYVLLKPLKVGLSYQFIDFNDTKYTDFQPRHRFNLFAIGSQKLGNFNFSLRERLQLTTKDESDRIKSSGAIDTYKINPAWVWRNRLKISYNIPHCKITPYGSFETFYQLNNPDGNVFDDLRYTIGVGYSLKKRHKFNLYYLIDNEINVKNPVRGFVLGAGYTYSF
jgi:hypothetical protein